MAAKIPISIEECYKVTVRLAAAIIASLCGMHEQLSQSHFQFYYKIPLPVLASNIVFVSRCCWKLAIL